MVSSREHRRKGGLAAGLLLCLLFSFGPSASAHFDDVTGIYSRRRLPSGKLGNGRMVVPVSSYSSYSLDEDDENSEQRSQRRRRRGEYRPWKAEPRGGPGAYSLTTKLVAANVIAYVLQVLFPSVTKWGMKVSHKILAGQDLYRLVTPMFLHGGVAHLMTNTYSLRAVGPDMESHFGGGRFLATYLVSGVTANLLSAVKSPNPALGASGAVFGVIAGEYVFLTRNKYLFGRYGEFMADNLLQAISINLILGLINPMVDNWGHIGGALGGAAMSYYFGPRLYMAGLPKGGDPAIVDKPIIRFPRAIESIPEQIGNRFLKMKRRMQVERYKADLPEKPWRRRAVPRAVPNKSIRPLP